MSFHNTPNEIRVFESGLFFPGEWFLSSSGVVMGASLPRAWSAISSAKMNPAGPVHLRALRSTRFPQVLAILASSHHRDFASVLPISAKTTPILTASLLYCHVRNSAPSEVIIFICCYCLSSTQASFHECRSRAALISLHPWCQAQHLGWSRFSVYREDLLVLKIIIKANSYQQHKSTASPKLLSYST